MSETESHDPAEQATVTHARYDIQSKANNWYLSMDTGEPTPLMKANPFEWMVEMYGSHPPKRMTIHTAQPSRVYVAADASNNVVLSTQIFFWNVVHGSQGTRLSTNGLYLGIQTTSDAVILDSDADQETNMWNLLGIK